MSEDFGGVIRLRRSQVETMRNALASSLRLSDSSISNGRD